MSGSTRGDEAGVRRAARLGGASLLLATVLFIAVFSYLAAVFDYPDVLDRPAGEVLPRLLALGEAGRAVWALYGLVPLLLLPTVAGLGGVTGVVAPLATRGATLAGVVAAFSMMLGLLRWPSLHWRLAAAYADAGAAERVAIGAVFDGANSYLGNFIGEFVGELALSLFFVCAAWALAAAASGRRRWLRHAGTAVGLLGLIAMFRNVTPMVNAAAELNNLVLPLWMATLGVALVTYRPGRDGD